MIAFTPGRFPFIIFILEVSFEFFPPFLKED